MKIGLTRYWDDKPERVEDLIRNLEACEGSYTIDYLAGSLIQSGEHLSPDTEFKPGRTPWNKGKGAFYEVRVCPGCRIEFSGRGKYCTPQCYHQFRAGRSRDPEIGRKISEALKGKPSGTKGKHFTEEHKEKIRQSNLGQKRSDQTRERLRTLAARKNNDPAYESFRKRQMQHLIGIQADNMTNIEKILLKYLQLNYPGEVIEPQYPIDRVIADFSIPEHQLIFEADGEYWHSLPGAKQRDKRRDSWLISQGWVVQRFQGQWLLDFGKKLSKLSIN